MKSHQRSNDCVHEHLAAGSVFNLHSYVLGGVKRVECLRSGAFSETETNPKTNAKAFGIELNRDDPPCVDAPDRLMILEDLKFQSDLSWKFFRRQKLQKSKRLLRQ